MDTDDEDTEAEAEAWKNAPVEPGGVGLTTAAKQRETARKLAADRPGLELLWDQIQRLMTVGLVGLFLAHPLEAQVALAAPAVVPTVAVVYVGAFTPPPSYAAWYAAAERCSGLTGNYALVRWYLAAHPWTSAAGVTYGSWQAPHRITVNGDGEADSVLVEHEALHDILSYYPALQTGGVHPLPWFDGRCSHAAYP